MTLLLEEKDRNGEWREPHHQSSADEQTTDKTTSNCGTTHTDVIAVTDSGS